MFFWGKFGLQDIISIRMSYLNFFHDFNLLIIFIMLFLIMGFIFVIFLNKSLKMTMLELEIIEIMWSVIPCFILILLGVPSMQLLYSTEGAETSPSVTMKITGHQWYWNYEFPEFLIQYDSFMILNEDLTKGGIRLLEVDNNVTLPMMVTNRMLVGSADVLHAWTLPSSGLKMDANPGRLSQGFIYSNFPGTFYGQCSELCGVNHSFMPICVEFVSNQLFLSYIIKNFS